LKKESKRRSSPTCPLSCLPLPSPLPPPLPLLLPPLPPCQNLGGLHCRWMPVLVLAGWGDGPSCKGAHASTRQASLGHRNTPGTQPCGPARATRLARMLQALCARGLRPVLRLTAPYCPKPP
jgi:hypothetical protein